MRRRDFIAGTAALLVSLGPSWAQATPRRVGYLDPVPKGLPLWKVWRDGLRDHGWIEGKNLIIDYRSAEGHAERLPPLAAELVALKPDLIVGPSPQVALALKSETATIPIVFIAVFDPVMIGLVPSLSRPGGNITGLATHALGDWIAKRIEILRELVPGASKIALLVNPDNPVQRLTLAEEVPRTARSFGVALPVVEATTAEELDTALETMHHGLCMLDGAGLVTVVNDRAEAIQEKRGDMKLRRQRLHVAVGYEIEREYEGDEATALHWELGELLDAEELSEAFTTEDFPGQISRLMD